MKQLYVDAQSPEWRQGTGTTRTATASYAIGAIVLNVIVCETSLSSEDHSTAKGRRALRAIGSSDGNNNACEDCFCNGQQEEA